MTTKQILWVVLVLGAIPLLAGCGGAVEAQGVSEVPAVSSDTGRVFAEAAIEPARWRDLHVPQGGEVVEVLVAPGDRVDAGDPLLRLDTRETAFALQSAQQDVVAQQAALERLTRGTGETLVARAARENAQRTAQAEVALDIRRLELAKTRAEDPATGLALAQAQAKGLKLQLAQARAQDPSPAVVSAEVELERARIALDDTRNEYNKALDRPWEPQEVRDAWAKQLEQAELTHQLAEAQLESARNARQAHELGVQALSAQIGAAETRLAQALDAQEAYSLTLEILDARIESAALELEALRTWENPYLDEASEQEITQAEAALRKAELAAARIELQRDRAVLRAPFAGTVVEVEAEVGDQVGAGQVVVSLATLDRLQARTTDLTELDVARVSAGQRATVTVDAFPGSPFVAQVREVDLRGRDHRGDIVYDVTVDLVDEDATGLRWGMTALVEFQTQ